MNIPTAVFINEFEEKSNYHVLNWTGSYDFNGEDVVYDVKISRNPEMTDIFFEEDNVIGKQVVIFDLEPGSYFVTVLAKNESGFTQNAYDYYVSREGRRYFGTKNLVVK